MKCSFLALIFIALWQSDSAYGYIDPGPSHLIMQFLVAILASSAFFIRRIFTFVKTAMSKPKTKNSAKKADGKSTKKNEKVPRKAA